MNALHLADKLKEAESKITHLRKAIEHLSETRDMAETVEMLGRVIRDYQVECEKMKKMLSQIHVPLHNSQTHSAMAERSEQTMWQ